jgi:sugar phosphate isomerase/epimerase
MKLSIAGWSLQQLFRAQPPKLQLLDFAWFCKDTFGVDAIELNNIFFAARDATYLQQLRAAADRNQVTLVNIAVDEKGDLASDDQGERELGIASYSAWIPIASQMGITAIRANSGGKNMTDPQRAVANCSESFKRLAELGRKHNVTILMENHWGLSADPHRLVQVLKAVQAVHGEESVGALADFGNWPDDVDRYEALKIIMPLAKGVHAKVLDIDEKLNHPRFDHARCLKIARDCGYDGYLGIEFEGTGDQVVGVKRSVTKLRGLLSGIKTAESQP